MDDFDIDKLNEDMTDDEKHGYGDDMRDHQYSNVNMVANKMQIARKPAPVLVPREEQ